MSLPEFGRTCTIFGIPSRSTRFLLDLQTVRRPRVYRVIFALKFQRWYYSRDIFQRFAQSLAHLVDGVPLLFGDRSFEVVFQLEFVVQPLEHEQRNCEKCLSISCVGVQVLHQGTSGVNRYNEHTYVACDQG